MYVYVRLYVYVCMCVCMCMCVCLLLFFFLNIFCLFVTETVTMANPLMVPSHINLSPFFSFLFFSLFVNFSFFYFHILTLVSYYFCFLMYLRFPSLESEVLLAFPLHL